MQATALDYTTTCRVCVDDDLPEAYDECPACGSGRHSHDDHDDGRVNRLAAAYDGEVRVDERTNQQGLVVLETVPIAEDGTGGFDGRYGPFTPDEIDEDLPPDVRDRLENTAENAPYSLAGRTVVEREEFPGEDCEGEDCETADPCIDCLIAWTRARGDDHEADLLEALKVEEGSPWG